jgi:hypothetical protein
VAKIESSGMSSFRRGKYRCISFSLNAYQFGRWISLTVEMENTTYDSTGGASLILLLFKTLRLRIMDTCSLKHDYKVINIKKEHRYVATEIFLLMRKKANST